MADEGSVAVELYIYDLTQGMAAMMSQMLLGRHVEGIWHTAVVIFGKEYFYGGHGIQCCPPGATILGQPTKIEKIGETFIPYQIFKDYIRGLSESTFRGLQYNFIKHNCNNFADDLCQFLCGVGIPKYILDLPQEILSTPLGQSLSPLIERLSAGSGGSNNFAFEPQISAREPSPEFDDLNSQIEEARQQSQVLEERRQTIREKIAKREKKKEKKKHRNSTKLSESASESNSNCGMSEAEEINGANGITEPIPPEMLPSEKILEEDAKERAEEEERRKNRIPPVVFHDIDAKTELDGMVKLLDGKLTKEEETNIEELYQYLVQGEGSWALGDNFLVFVGRVLREPSISSEARVHLIRVLAAAALKDDVILILHQDRRDHMLMNFSQDIDRIPIEEQTAWALFICNLFENLSASEWLLYISEWSYNNQQISNIRGTTKVAVHCLLATCSTLQDIGTSIIYNLAIKEVKTVVFDDVAVELTMAILQFFNTKPSEEHLFRTLRALAAFVNVSPDVPQFIQMIGPHPNTFKGTSQRIDELIDQISVKVK